MDYILKKLLYPLTNSLTLVLVLTVWALLHKRRRVILLCAIVAALCLFGYPALPGRFRKALVTQYAPLTEFRPGITNIVVLCAGRFATDASVPVNGRATPGFLYRLMEGIRLLREAPGRRVLVSVSSPDDPAAAGSILHALAGLLDVQPGSLVPVVGAKNTRDEARLMRDVVGTNAFYLVTSDLHMPRAMIIFEQAGMQPVAAPTGSCGRGDGERPLLGNIYSRSENLCTADLAIHEHLGIIWARLVGPATHE